MPLSQIPFIKDELLGDQARELKDKLDSGVITEWLNEELRWLSTNNPALYKFITEHAQKFAMGVVMVGDPHSIALSQALEQVLLLGLVNATLRGKEELQKFEQMMSKFFPNGKINGLEGLNGKKL